MTKRKVELEDDNGIAKSFGYDIIKWGTFVAPPTAIFVALYFLMGGNLLYAGLGTAIAIIIAVCGISLWWIRKTEKGVIIEKK